MLKKTLVLLFIVSNYSVFAQYSSFYHFFNSLKCSAGYINYIDGKNTQKLMRKHKGYSINAYYDWENNLFIKISDKFSISTLNQNIRIGNYNLYEDEQFRFNTLSLELGYSYKLSEKFSINPHAGLIDSFFKFSRENENTEETYNKLGLTFGFSLNLYFNVSRETPEFIFLFLNNNFNYTRLNDINESFNNFGYVLEIGLGFRLYDPSNKEMKKFKVKL